jgi:hypothetical protein
MANLREISFFSLGVTRVLARAQLHVEALPLAQIIFAFTPNSAAAERVFSMLKAMFGDQQMETLADIIQTALMLRINKRRVGRAVLMEYSKAVKCAYE